MSKTFFQIGTRVRVNHQYDGARVGMAGIVRKMPTLGEERVGVEFDFPFKGGHNLSGLLNDKLGFRKGHFIPANYLVLDGPEFD